MLLPVVQSQKEIRKKSKKLLKQEIVCDIAIPSMFCNLCSYGGFHKWIPKIVAVFHGKSQSKMDDN